jgi:ADP-ribose pyrophosphatase YjhB (NUDIX family)
MSLPTIDEYPERYRYRFCPMDTTPLERVTVHGIERLRCPQCGWVLYVQNNMAATTLVEYQGGVVLARRSIPPDVGMWHLPIGHVEFGEAPEAAAAREAYEETGLEVADLRFLIYEHSPGYGDPLMWYVVFGFAARAVGGTLTTSDETSELQVLPLDEMPELKWTSQQKTVAAYRALQQKG